jgi:purine nucleoside phosphorylase
VVTNLAAGLARRSLSHAEVTATAAQVEERLAALVTGFLGRAVR